MGTFLLQEIAFSLYILCSIIQILKPTNTLEVSHMALNPEIRAKLQARIDELKKRMQYDANDLDYETHLNQVRELQKIISAAK